MSQKRKSLVYNHFDVDPADDKRLICQFCKSKITSHAGALEKHLRTSHVEQFADYEKEKEKQVKKKKLDPKPISSFFTQKPSPVLMKHCVGLVVNGGRPFKMFDDYDMKAILDIASKKLEPGSGTSEMKYNRENVQAAVVEEARRERQQITQKLRGKLLSLSIDMATCMQRSFIGVNAQLSFNNEIQLFCLECREVHERHTADNIKQWIKNAMSKFEISKHQLLAISIDSARNVTKAVDDLAKEFTEIVETEEDLNEKIDDFDDEDVEEDSDNIAMEGEDEDFMFLDNDDLLDNSEARMIRVHCAAHKLQLGVNDFLVKCKKTSKTISLSQKLAAKLRTQVMRILIKNENLKYAILDQKTRWSSTYQMLERLLELKQFCNEKATNFKALKVSEERWKTIEDICQALKPIARLTTELQNEKLDVSQMVAYWKDAMFNLFLLKTWSSKKLYEFIELREKSVFNNSIVLSAMYLDKRFSSMLKDEEKVVAKTFIRQACNKKNTLQGQGVQISPSETTAVDETPSPFEAHLGSIYGPSSTSIAAMNQLDLQFTRLDSQPRQPFLISTTTTYMRDFWNRQKDDFSLLKNIVFDIISVPMTEVSVERLFSHLNFVLNKQRSNLKGEILNDILFLRMNAKSLKEC